MKNTPRFLALIIFLTLSASAPGQLSSDVKSWLAKQSGLLTWTANLVQTRALQSLTEPVQSPGRVWFEAPARFRWELGQPPKTIAVSTATNLLLIYPRLKRVESITLGGDQNGPWRSALDMLQAGFPRNEQELSDHYNILSQAVSGGICKLQLQPRTAAIQAMMRRLEIDFNTKDFLLRGTELEFADGSTLRNDFTDIVVNPKLTPDELSPNIPADYTVVHPQVQH